MADQSKLGAQVWFALSDRPLGSLTKRELELMLITAAIDSSGLVEPAPVQLAQVFTALAACLVQIAMLHHLSSER